LAELRSHAAQDALAGSHRSSGCPEVRKPANRLGGGTVKRFWRHGARALLGHERVPVAIKLFLREAPALIHGLLLALADRGP
jgi:hypothetical protein